MSEANGDNLHCLVRLCNAIKEAIEEMERCPDDSIQDIWNEKLEEWQTGLWMDVHHNIEPNAGLHQTSEAQHNEKG